MAKRTQRLAGGLAVVLAGSLVGGGVVGILHCPSTLQAGRVRITALPIRDWRVGCGPVVYNGCGLWGSRSVVVGHRVTLGMLEVELGHH
jgi:hypothetical protein